MVWYPPDPANAVTDIVVDPDPVIEVGLKLAVYPAERPSASKDTGIAGSVAVTFTVYEVVPITATLAVPETVLIVKSTGTVHVPNCCQIVFNPSLSYAMRYRFLTPAKAV